MHAYLGITIASVSAYDGHRVYTECKECRDGRSSTDRKANSRVTVSHYESLPGSDFFRYFGMHSIMVWMCPCACR